MRKVVVASVSTLGLMLTACASGSLDAECGACGDCTPSIRFHGVVYVTDSRVNSTQSFGQFAGPGAALDCDHRTILDHVTVSKLTEVESRQAIGVRRGTWHGVYVAADLPRKQWPAVLSAK
jgi:hypothetical protein